MSDTNDDTLIKHIGKGSFSNVYLYKNMSTILSSSLFDDIPILKTNYYIIKEVNLNVLVDKYLKSKQKIRLRSRQNSSIIVIQKENKNSIPIKRDTTLTLNSYKNLNLTPYSAYKGRITPTINVNYNTEEEYYYKKLKNLIDSEIDILKSLDHPNIITYISNTFNNDIFHIKMEYCDYGDLTNLLRGNNFSRNIFNGFTENIIHKFLLDTSDALLYLHSQGIIHRDIKLQNILIKSEDGSFIFKISDFGFSCNIPTTASDSSHKKYFKLCGTPYYMAPEMITNVDKFEQLINSDESSLKKDAPDTSLFYDTKIDLWSYGICLYELIFNILPFTNMSEITDLKIFYSRDATQNIINRNINEKDIISDDIKFLLKKLLTIDPKDRFTTQELHEYIRTNVCKSGAVVLKITDIITYTVYDKEVIEHDLSKINMNSWIRIDGCQTVNSDSLLKMSVDKPFMNWLLDNPSKK
jgi:serine/threonine protein kinase